MNSIFARLSLTLALISILSACSGAATPPPAAPTDATVTAAGQSKQTVAPEPAQPSMIQETVHYQSYDGLNLVGYIFRPNGPGPYPTIIWNHGSEQDPSVDNQFKDVAEQFVPAGYVVMAPVRRGQGSSEGEYITDTMDAYKAQSPAPSKEDRQNHFMDLMESQQVKDQLAGLNYVKAQSYVDKDRLGVIGCSYGGMETLIAAGQDNTGFKAAVAISPGAETWESGETFQQRLVNTVNSINIPIFLIHPSKDVSLEPGYHLGQALQKQQKAYSLKIFPPIGKEKFQGHCFGGNSKIWAPDAIQFFGQVFQPPTE